MLKLEISLRARLGLAAVTAVIAIVTAPADASIINSPVPTNAYIVYDGIDWAWGSPCSYANGGCGSGGADLTYQSTQGWGLPTAGDLAIVNTLDDSGNPGAFASLFYSTSGNVPFGGVDPVSGAGFNVAVAGSCATPYFNFLYAGCDSSDADAGEWAGSDNFYGSSGYAEQLFVRNAAPTGVPEPSSWVLMLSGFGLVGQVLRKRATKVSYAAS